MYGLDQVWQAAARSHSVKPERCLFCPLRLGVSAMQQLEGFAAITPCLAVITSIPARPHDQMQGFGHPWIVRMGLSPGKHHPAKVVGSRADLVQAIPFRIARSALCW